jgi:hypothetical protein
LVTPPRCGGKRRGCSEDNNDDYEDDFDHDDDKDSIDDEGDSPPDARDSLAFIDTNVKKQRGFNTEKCQRTKSPKKRGGKRRSRISRNPSINTFSTSGSMGTWESPQLDCVWQSRNLF